MKKRLLIAPFGYQLTEEIDTNNEQDILRFTLSLSDDPEYQETVKKDSHKERLKNLKANGFTY